MIVIIECLTGKSRQLCQYTVDGVDKTKTHLDRIYCCFLGSCLSNIQKTTRGNSYYRISSRHILDFVTRMGSVVTQYGIKMVALSGR